MYGRTSLKNTKVLFVLNFSKSPDGKDTLMMEYSRINPFLVSGGGGCHSSFAVVEDIASAVTFRGGDEGTAEAREYRDVNSWPYSVTVAETCLPLQ